MVSFILSTTFFITKIPPLKRFSKVSVATSLFSIFIQQNAKRTIVLYICKILEECPKALLNMFLIDVVRVMLPRRPQRRHFLL